MTRKPSRDKVVAPPADEKPTLTLPQFQGETPAAAAARNKMRPALQAAVTLASWGNFHLAPLKAADPNEVLKELEKRAKAVSANDLSRLEELLTNQTHTLDAIFNDCARIAHLNRGEYLNAFERYMRIALKAQSQCRSNVEALAEIKNPKSFTVVGQANVAHGPQQVNNGVSGAVLAPAHARENANQPNELLEHSNAERLEPLPTSEASARHPQVASVDEIDGAKVA